LEESYGANLKILDLRFLIFDYREKLQQDALPVSRLRQPEAPAAKAEDFMDNRFIKELDESCFIKALYSKWRGYG
jgi:hypothetical protein